MAEKISTSIRVDADVKEAAAKVFKSLGLDFSSGIDVYLRTVARERRIPFELDLRGRGERDG